MEMPLTDVLSEHGVGEVALSACQHGGVVEGVGVDKPSVQDSFVGETLVHFTEPNSAGWKHI